MEFATDSTNIFDDCFWVMSPLPFYLNIWPFKCNHVAGEGPRALKQRVPSGVTLRIIEDGAWTIRMKNASHAARPGDIFCAMPSMPIEFSVDGQGRWGWWEINFQGNEAERFLKEFGLGEEKPVITPLKPVEALRLFKSLHGQMKASKRSRGAFLSALFALIGACGASNEDISSSQVDLVTKAKLILESAPFVNRNIAELAEMLGIDRSTLYKAFKAETGLSPHEYTDTLRISRAKELLDGTKMPLSVIAAQTGFADVKYFIGWFKSKTASPPGAWRKNSFEDRRKRDRQEGL